MFTARHFIARTTSGEFVDAAGATMQILTRYGVRETAGATASVRFMAGGSSAPATPTGAQSSTAGSVTIGNKTAKVVYNMPNGSTTPSSASASFSNDGSHKATITFAAPPIGATGTSVYLNTSGRNEIQRITLTAGNAPVNEIQTLTLIAGATGDTFKLTWSAVESSAVTIGAPDYTGVTLAQIQAALTSISGLAGKYTATGPTGGPFAITFTGTLAGTDVSAITVTSKTGAADGSVAETTKGSTDSFTLAYSAVDSSVISIPAGGYASVTLSQVQAALTSIAALTGNYTATGSTGGPFDVTFNGGLADTNVSALSLTNAVGASAATFTTVTGGVAQGTTWYKGEAGISPSVAPGLTTYEFAATDAALVGYDAAPTTNTSGEEVDVIALAANERANVALSTPENGLRMRVEVLSGAVVARVAGQ